MARYRKIDTRTWNDQKFNALSDDAKLVFFLLLTHPHLTPIGAMRATLAGLASELRWSAERFTSAFNECAMKDMVRHDEFAAFVWLPNFLRYNQPESPNVVRSWEQYLDYLPECQLKNDLIHDVGDFVQTLSVTFQEALPQAFGKAMPNQEQEQEQKQEQEKNVSSGKPDAVHENNSNDKQNDLKSQAMEILNFLNEKTGRGYRPVDANLKLIIARLKSGVTLRQCFQVIAKKTRERGGDLKMAEYLRPATLFNEKLFEQYLGELVEVKAEEAAA